MSSAPSFTDSSLLSEVGSACKHLGILSDCSGEGKDVWGKLLSLVCSVESSTFGGSGKSHLSAGIFLDDGKLLFTDSSNRRLLLFDDSYSFIQDFKLDGQPIDIAKGNETKDIFVALREDGILRCTFKSEYQFSITSRMLSPDDTWGLAFIGNKRLIGAQSCVRILAADGQDIRSVSKSGLDTYVAVSPSQKLFYHKDGNHIVCRKEDGLEYFRYVNAALLYPVGIGLDGNGNVYVCGRNSGNIHMFSQDGIREKILLEKLAGITKPYAVVVNPINSEIVVTSSKESIAFEVYRFCGDD